MWVCKAQTLPMEVYDNMTSAVKYLTRLQEKEDVIDVVNDEIKEGTRRKIRLTLMQFITADHHKTLILVKLRDQHCDETNDKETYLEARVRDDPDQLTLRVEEWMTQKVFVDFTRINEIRDDPLSVDSDWSASW